jgi:hypothetical protein
MNNAMSILLNPAGRDISWLRNQNRRGGYRTLRLQRGGRFELQLIEAMVDTARSQQFLMRARLAQLAFV